MFKQIRAWFGTKPQVAARPRTQGRSYAAAKSSRLTAGWQTSVSSADAELVGDLEQLRSRSRALIRDASYAKRARDIVVNNVIGQGIGLQASVATTRGTMATRVNDAIELAWWAWTRADACHTGGTLHFADFERQCMAQVFEAGEVFVRKHYAALGSSKVPITLELIEAERMASDSQPPAPMRGRSRMGIEMDDYFRPVAYWIRDRMPGDHRWSTEKTDQIVRVPADQIYHLRLVNRWPQTRGEPWMHAAARKLNDMDGYSEAEIVAAVGAASYMATIETSNDDSPMGAETMHDGSLQTELQPGAIEKLAPGETLNFISPNRPNAAMDPFMRMMLREVASGIGVSYESLSRDYSQSNYSSSRLALLDDRDTWRALQQWFIRSFREPLHREWLQLAVLAGAIPELDAGTYANDMDKYSAVTFKPRGWSWIDPTKEVEAYKEAVRCGFMTHSDVISQTGAGRDRDEIWQELHHEQELAAELDLKFDTGPIVAETPPPTAPPPEPDDDDEGEDDPAADEPDEPSDPPQERVVSFRRS